MVGDPAGSTETVRALLSAFANREGTLTPVSILSLRRELTRRRLAPDIKPQVDLLRRIGDIDVINFQRVCTSQRSPDGKSNNARSSARVSARSSIASNFFSSIFPALELRQDNSPDQDLAMRVIGPRAAKFQRPPGGLDLGSRVGMRVQHVGGLGGVLVDRAEVGQ